MTLKTLKDINPGAVAWFKDIPVVKRTDLQQAAREWIEELNEAVRSDRSDSIPKALQPCDHIKNWQGHAVSITVWIKHFFNLEDEQ